jgi:hypothetical protein
MRLLPYLSSPLWGVLIIVSAASSGLIACDTGGEDGETGTTASEPERFNFVRTRESIVRLDTATGQVWLVAMNGDGGWQSYGQPPAADGRADKNGRYAVNTVGRSGSRSEKASQSLLLMDRASGRAWLAPAAPGAHWLMISGATPSGSTAPASRAASATKTHETPQRPGMPQTAAAPGAASGPKAQLNVIPKEAFGKTPEEAARDADVIIRALQKEGMPVEVQVWAAKQLGVFDKELAVKPLLQALHSDHPEVVVAAIGALGQISAPETIPKILALQSHADPRVRAAVEEIVVEVR